MDLLKRRGLPMMKIELYTKLTAQSTIAVLGVLANVFTIVRLIRKSKIPKSTRTMMISLSVALSLQAMNSFIDYSNNISNQDEYFWGFTVCDVWNTLNLYFPMMLTLHCFFCLLERYLLLAHPDLHVKMISLSHLIGMLTVVYILPLLVAVPPVVFEWYPANGYLKWRTNKECKFKTNLVFTIIFPIFTFWIPLGLTTFIIAKMFQAMKCQDEVCSFKRRKSRRTDSAPNQSDSDVVSRRSQDDLWRDQMLALTFWSVYWNLALFWIPHHVWQVVCKVTGAEWPRASNFMIWTGYSPSFVLPVLYLYYDVYNL